MSESILFLLSGKVLWYAICFAACTSAIAGAIIAPVMAYKSIRWNLWKWRLASEIAASGFDAADIRFALSVPGSKTDTEAFLIFARRVKDRGDSLVARRKAEGKL